MKTSVYMSNNILRIAVGDKRRITRLLSLSLNSESLINGLIVNEAAFVKEIENIWHTYGLSRNISLVMNSSQFIARSLAVAANMKNKIPQLVRNEYFGTEQLTLPLFDYRIYDNRGGRLYLLATAVSEDYVKNLISVFASAGITVRSLTTPLYSSMKFFEMLTVTAESCQIALVFDNSMLTTFLNVNGKYYYSRGARVLAEQGTPEFVTEVVGSANSMLQFRSTERIIQPITAIQLFGFTPEMSEGIMAAVAAQATIPVEDGIELPSPELPSEKDLINDENSPEADTGTCLFAIGDMLS